MVQQLTDTIYSIKIPLPGNPLKDLNSYVIKTPKRNLIIDTGFNMPECLAAMRSGIAELAIDMQNTDLFITHLHADHSGLIYHIASPSSKIYISATDGAILRFSLTNHTEYMARIKRRFLNYGFPEDVFAQSISANHAFKSTAETVVPFTEVVDGDDMRIGSVTLRCLHTPGHTPGHMCLYEPNEKLLFAGDHILFDITPNITPWQDIDDALGMYLESLIKIKTYDISRTFAAHRENGMSVYERADQLIAHHQARLDELYEIIRQNPGIDCYNAASKMTWSIRAKDWSDFPATQKFFAVGEAAAHIDHLLHTGRVRGHAGPGVKTYTVNDR